MSIFRRRRKCGKLHPPRAAVRRARTISHEYARDNDAPADGPIPRQHCVIGVMAAPSGGVTTMHFGRPPGLRERTSPRRDEPSRGICVPKAIFHQPATRRRRNRRGNRISRLTQVFTHDAHVRPTVVYLLCTRVLLATKANENLNRRDD